MNASLWQLAGWTMIHSLWLGAAIALAGGFLRIAARRAAPNTRYAISLATLALLAATPIAAAGWLGVNGVPQLAVVSPTSASLPLPLGEGWGEGQNRQETLPPLNVGASSENPFLGPPVPGADLSALQSTTNDVIDLAHSNPSLQSSEEWGEGFDQLPTTPYAKATVGNLPPTPSLPGRGTPQPPTYSPSHLSPFIPHLPTLWLIGAPLTFTLLATGLVGSARLRRRATPLLVGPAHEACERLRQTLNITRRVALAVSDGVAQPILVGVLRPLILLPAAALAGWTPEQLDMVLLHELAHVRRRDNLVNLLQRIVESLLFFHPAVWLVSRQVRRDREECCDAAVIRHTDRPHQYAELLVSIAAALRGGPAPSLAVASAMASHPLAGRIRRILNIEEEPMRITRRTLVAALLLPALLAGAMLYSGAKAEDGNNAPPSKGQPSVASDDLPQIENSADASTQTPANETAATSLDDEITRLETAVLEGEREIAQLTVFKEVSQVVGPAAPHFDRILHGASNLDPTVQTANRRITQINEDLRNVVNGTFIITEDRIRQRQQLRQQAAQQLADAREHFIREQRAQLERFRDDEIHWVCEEKIRRLEEAMKELETTRLDLAIAKKLAKSREDARSANSPDTKDAAGDSADVAPPRTDVEIPLLQNEIRNLESLILKSKQDLINLQVFKELALQSGPGKAAIEAAVAAELDKDPTIKLYQNTIAQMQKDLESHLAKAPNPNNSTATRGRAAIQQSEAKLEEYRRAAEKSVRERLAKLPNEEIRNALTEYNIRRQAIDDNIAKYQQDLEAAKAKLSQLGAVQPTPILQPTIPPTADRPDSFPTIQEFPASADIQEVNAIADELRAAGRQVSVEQNVDGRKRIVDTSLAGSNSWNAAALASATAANLAIKLFHEKPTGETREFTVAFPSDFPNSDPERERVRQALEAEGYQATVPPPLQTSPLGPYVLQVTVPADFQKKPYWQTLNDGTKVLQLLEDSEVASPTYASAAATESPSAPSLSSNLVANPGANSQEIIVHFPPGFAYSDEECNRILKDLKSQGFEASRTQFKFMEATKSGKIEERVVICLRVSVPKDWQARPVWETNLDANGTPQAALRLINEPADPAHPLVEPTTPPSPYSSSISSPVQAPPQAAKSAGALFTKQDLPLTNEDRALNIALDRANERITFERAMRKSNPQRSIETIQARLATDRSLLEVERDLKNLAAKTQSQFPEVESRERRVVVAETEAKLKAIRKQLKLEREAGGSASPNEGPIATASSADNAQPTADRDSLKALSQSQDELKKVFEPRPENPSRTINYSTDKVPQQDVSLYEDMFQGLQKDPYGPQLAFDYSIDANTKIMRITAPLEAHRKFFKPIFAGELSKAAHPPAPASTADESPTLAEFLKAFVVQADNPVVTREFHTAADRRSIDLLLHAIGGHPNAQNVELEWKWLDNGQLELKAPEQAHAILKKDIPDSLIQYIQERFSPFPTLENQKIADRAYKLLGLELDPLAPEELKRVKKLGYAGGLRVTRGNDAAGLLSNDLLVGLHVWPVIDLKSLDEVLQRDDLGELNPLKYYVIRNGDGFSRSTDEDDSVVTGRLSIPEAELLSRGLEQTNKAMAQLAPSAPAAGDLNYDASQAIAPPLLAPSAPPAAHAPADSPAISIVQAPISQKTSLFGGTVTTAYLKVKFDRLPGAVDNADGRTTPQEIERSAMNCLTIVKSPSVLRAALHAVTKNDPAFTWNDEAIESLQKRLGVSFPGDGEILELKLEESGAEGDNILLQAIIDAFIAAMNAPPESPANANATPHPRTDAAGDLHAYVDSQQQTPPSPATLKPGDSVLLKAVGALPDAPLDGVYQIEAEGTLPLGPAYGRVAIADMTLLDAEQKIQAHLQPTLHDVVVQLTLQPADKISDFGVPSPIADKTFRRVSSGAPQAAVTFLYDGKTFEEWRDLWKLELNPERRTEAINALAAFGRTGHGQEAADAILDVAGEYDAHYDESTPEGKLLLAVLTAVSRMPAEQWMPQVQQRIIAAKEPEKSLWIRHAQHFLGASNDQSEDARRHAAKLGRIPSDHLVTSTALFLWRSDSNLDQPETVELLRRGLQQKSPGISVVSLGFRHLDKLPEQLDVLVRDSGARSELNSRIGNDKEMAARLYPPLLEMLKDPNRAEDRIGVLRALRVIGPVVRQHESLENRILITDELMELLRTAPDELLPAAFVAYTKYWGSSNYDEILSSLLEQGQLPAERVKHLRDLEPAILKESNAP